MKFSLSVWSVKKYWNVELFNRRFSAIVCICTFYALLQLLFFVPIVNVQQLVDANMW